MAAATVPSSVARRQAERKEEEGGMWDESKEGPLAVLVPGFAAVSGTPSALFARKDHVHRGQ